MKKALLVIGIFILAAVVGLGFAGCSKCSGTPQEPGPEGGTTAQGASTVGGTGTLGSSTAAAGPVTAEIYWKITLEQKRAQKQNLTDKVAVYEKYQGNSPEAAKEIADLEAKFAENVKKVFADNGVADEAALQQAGPDRETFLAGHPEIKTELDALSNDVTTIEAKVAEWAAKQPPAPAGGSTAAAPAPAGGSTAAAPAAGGTPK